MSRSNFFTSVHFSAYRISVEKLNPRNEQKQKNANFITKLIKTLIWPKNQHKSISVEKERLTREEFSLRAIISVISTQSLTLIISFIFQVRDISTTGCPERYSHTSWKLQNSHHLIIIFISKLIRNFCIHNWQKINISTNWEQN